MVVVLQENQWQMKIGKVDENLNCENYLLRKQQYSLLPDYEVTDLYATHRVQQKGGDYLFKDWPEQWNVVKITKAFCSEIKKEVLREKTTIIKKEKKSLCVNPDIIPFNVITKSKRYFSQSHQL